MELAKSLLVSTFMQFWWLFGVMMVIGVLLYFFGRVARQNYVNSVGEGVDTYLTGWIGTPVHEFGHWLFCIVFGHKVKEVRFYKPDKKSGTLGYVNHSYDAKSIYQRIGNFFIGIGPILVGSAVIVTLAYFMLPNTQRILANFSDFVVGWPIEVSYGWRSAIHSVLDNVLLTFKMLFIRADYASLPFWGFVFLSLAISSHMMLSIADLKTAWQGAAVVVLALLLLNITSYLLVKFSGNAIPFTLSNKMQLISLKVGASFIYILSFSLVMSLANVVLSAVFRVVHMLVKRK